MFKKITSRDNQKLKYVRKVRDGKIKDAVFVEGVRLGEEVLRSNLTINECFFCGGFTENKRGRELINTISEAAENISEIEKTIFPTLADTKTSQGIILIVEKPLTTKENFESRFDGFSLEFPIVLFLSEINNPSNLGAILRTAEAVGVKSVIISENSADAFSPKSARSALGANLRLTVRENANLKDVLIWAKKKNLVTTAADINAKSSYTEIDWKFPRLLIFGSEAHGLSVEDLKMIEKTIYVPMENGVESLNLAVSCGIILFEAKRQSVNLI
ncbi:MAG: RNA methyltransferase [Pyrinomonadaceae bacterium]|nr:RNA methyltransferase [Pyrinomonadaceae bacterium]